jgi:very-short-patch-repair endonuclease
MRVHRRTRARAKALRWPMTRAEVIVWTRLQGRQLSGFFFRKQHPVGPYIADFACVKSRVLIEIDGETHWREFERRRDAARTAFLERAGWTVVRFRNGEVYENEVGVVETILRFVMDGEEGRVRARGAIRRVSRE